LEILTIQQKLYESCFNSVAEVARILDFSIKKIYRMAAKGQIPSLKISNSIRFDPHDIELWLRSQSSTNTIPAVLLPSPAYLRRSNGRQLDHAPRI
jgi:excisionase family DNA binding protein